MTNPLLTSSELPPFPDISLPHFSEAIEEVIKANRALIRSLECLEIVTWANFVQPLERAEQNLSSIWSLLSHYNGVLNSPELRGVYAVCLERVTEYGTELSQNELLFKAYQALASSVEHESYSEAQKSSLEAILRGFRLGGCGLSESNKQVFGEQSKALSQLKNQFSQNVLDATQGWSKWLADSAFLQGVPESALAMFAQSAKDKGYDTGFLLSLDVPSYLPIVTYCDNRSLRREIYDAYMTRASEQGDGESRWDNSDIIDKILCLRKSQSNLLGFSNYAELSLEPKMAKSVESVVEFLEDLARKSKPQAQRELDELLAFSTSLEGPSELEPWDIPYYSEKLKQQNFGFSKEELRAYFPLPKVLGGMLQVASRLFGVSFRVVESAPTYHADVVFYEVLRDGQVIAGFYLDLYARENKRGGAWLATCRSRYRLAGKGVQTPISFLVCNFTPASHSNPSLLIPDEVKTLFHEFGHCLHSTLTSVEVANVSGISSVPWDAVELPSQLMENWCWQEEVLPLLSEHVDTGEPLAVSLLSPLKNSQNFMSGMMMLRQTEFALFDFVLHRDFVPGETDILSILESVRDQVAVSRPPSYTRFSHGFSHIFAGGYAAGYYSYKWAEVLAADAFSRFEEEGVMSEVVGESFCKEFLELGGSRDVMDMFIAFRGREPRVESLLRQSGIQNA